jgi:hypothetical protein
MLGVGSRADVLVRLAGVVAEDKPTTALPAGIHDRALSRRRELLEHLGVDALVLRPERRIAQALLQQSPMEVARIGRVLLVHACREYLGNEDDGPRSLDRRASSGASRPHFTKCICVSVARVAP